MKDSTGRAMPTKQTYEKPLKSKTQVCKDDGRHIAASAFCF